ncbi:MAG: tetratricopeptide repeat protein [Syntrophobacteraceae bacterium]
MADSADSIKKYKEILELDPSSRVFARLAEELGAAGEWEEAAEVCRKGLLLHPEHLVARMLFGRALLEIGDVEESERVLAGAVEEIEKNSIIFKLLAELDAMSGKEESGARYARIYEAFSNSAPAELQTSGSAQPSETSERDDSEAQATQPLDADLTDVQVELADGEKISFGDVLQHLAQRFDGRLNRVGAPQAILTQDDKDVLKERIIALLQA